MKASPLSYDPRDNYKIDDIESGELHFPATLLLLSLKYF